MVCGNLIVCWMACDVSVRSIRPFVLAALFAAVPAIFGQKKTRIVAAVLLLVSILFAVSKYPEFRSEQERFRSRAKNTSTK